MRVVAALIGGILTISACRDGFNFLLSVGQNIDFYEHNLERIANWTLASHLYMPFITKL